MAIQDEKVSINDILIEKNSSLREDINKKLCEDNVKSRKMAVLQIINNYNIFKIEELRELFSKLSLDKSDEIKLLVVNFLISEGEKVFQPEKCQEIIRAISNNTKNIKIKNTAEKFLLTANENSKSYEGKQNLSNKIELSNGSDFRQQMKLYDYSQSNQLLFKSQYNMLQEYILCVTLWIGGDGAIFNSSEIAYYLPFRENEIRLSLEKLRTENILMKKNNDYVLTERGSVLADASLIKIIATWYSISEWIDNPKYKTIHHGFLNDKRNMAISNLLLSSRSFITDFFHVILENLAKFYNNMDISYFTDFRKLLILLSLNPTIGFIAEKGNGNCSMLLNTFLHDDILKIANYNNEKIILINNEYFKRKHKKVTRLESGDKW